MKFRENYDCVSHTEPRADRYADVVCLSYTVHMEHLIKKTAKLGHECMISSVIFRQYK
jgi:hypothetical protein